MLVAIGSPRDLGVVCDALVLVDHSCAGPQDI
jgi:hypothetical protein